MVGMNSNPQDSQRRNTRTPGSQTSGPRPVVSRGRQWLIIGGMLSVAVLAMVLAAIYQDDNKLGEPTVVGAGTSTTVATGGGAVGVPAASTEDSPTGTGPIEGFLPRSGEASACREQIGVDLADGFGAKLTINGTEIPPEEMNVNLDENGEISEVITASRSLGHYTFAPDDNCPNGSLLRPVDNVLEVCVYRLSDVTQACTVRQENIFDAL